VKGTQTLAVASQSEVGREGLLEVHPYVVAGVVAVIVLLSLVYLWKRFRGR
jgi:hypothetical protein